MKAIYIRQGEKKAASDYASAVAAIRKDFSAYLETYPAKTSRSKHGLLGPVGIVLREAKGNRWDAEGLTGFALSVHSNNPRTKGWIEVTSLAHLKAGVSALLTLLESAPVGLRDELVRQIDYGLYLDRREAGLEYIATVKANFAAFARQSYRSGAEAAKAWGAKPEEVGADFERLRYPTERLFTSDKWKSDLAEFKAQAPGPVVDEDEEGGEEV